MSAVGEDDANLDGHEQRPAAGTGYGVSGDGSEVLLPHGYTLARLDRVTREAAYGSRWMFLTIAERIDAARFAIVEHLYTCDEPGDFWAVVRVGERAIHHHVVKDMHHKGSTPKTNNLGAVPMPRYWTYWRSTSMPTRSPEDSLVDALALHQILPRLSTAYQRVLLALAEHDDYPPCGGSPGQGVPRVRLDAVHRRQAVPAVVVRRRNAVQGVGPGPAQHPPTRRTGIDYKKITIETIRRRRQKREKKQQASGETEHQQGEEQTG